VVQTNSSLVKYSAFISLSLNFVAFTSSFSTLPVPILFMICDFMITLKQ
jgi:hypothetical protein